MTRSRTALLTLISTAALCLPIGLAGPSSAATNPAPKVIVKAPNPRTGVVTGRVLLGGASNSASRNFTATPATKGTVAIDATSGAFTYTPTAAARRGAKGANGPNSFTITVTDGYGGTDSISWGCCEPIR